MKKVLRDLCNFLHKRRFTVVMTAGVNMPRGYEVEEHEVFRFLIEIAVWNKNKRVAGEKASASVPSFRVACKPKTHGGAVSLKLLDSGVVCVSKTTGLISYFKLDMWDPYVWSLV